MHRKGIRTTTALLLVPVAALLLIGIGGRDEEVEPLPRAGPVLAGESVLWAASRPDGEALLRMWKNGRETSTVYKVQPTAERPDWGLTGLATSGTRVGFNRSWTECPPVRRRTGRDRWPRGPGCYNVGADTLIGDVGGKLKTLPRARCPNDRGGDFDFEGSVAAYIESTCGDEAREAVRVIVQDVVRGGAAEVIRKANDPSPCCGGVRIAGRFVAWNEGSLDGSWSVVVYDREAGKESYRARPGRRAEYSDRIKFDVQRDGKVLVAYQRPTLGVMFAGLAWFSEDEPTLHPLPFRALIPESGNWGGVRFARDQYAFERLRRGGSELVVADLQGRLVANVAAFGLAKQRWGDFDFDGEGVVWAERETRTRSFLECAPGRDHCPIRERGWISVFLAERRTEWKPKRIARAPFTFYDWT